MPDAEFLRFGVWLAKLLVSLLENSSDASLNFNPIEFDAFRS